MSVSAIERMKFEDALAAFEPVLGLRDARGIGDRVQDVSVPARRSSEIPTRMSALGLPGFCRDQCQ